jgi:AcrR family transcriptional regulator
MTADTAAPGDTAPDDPAPSDSGPSYGDYAARSRATQLHLLDTAVEVLVESGYSGASTLKIQERAGVSRGRLLHQYPHRDALLVAAVQHLVEARISVLHEDVEWPDDPILRVGTAVKTMWATYHQGYFWAATELWLAARYTETLADALVPHERALGSVIRAATDSMFGAELTARPRYADLREMLITSMRGVALTYSFDHRSPDADPHLQLWTEFALRELELD